MLKRLTPALALAAAVAVTLTTAPDARAGDIDIDIRLGDYRLPRVRTVRVVRTVHEHGAHCEYVAGHEEVHIERDVEPGYWRVVRHPAVYAVRRHGRCGERERVLVRPARVDRIWVPARVIEREVRTWVPGHWSCDAC